MKALVLAAGLGKRMRPLTFTRPKFLLPVAGKPALDRVLELLVGTFEEVGMVVGYGREQIMERYGEGSGLGVKITYFHQKELLGTAQAVSLARDWVKGEDFLVINGDTLTDEVSIRALLDLHRQRKGDPDFGGCLATYEVEEASQYGVVFLEGNRVVRVEEKPKAPEVRTVNAGVYTFTPEIFRAIERTEKSERGEYEITASLQLLLREGRKLYASPLGFWADLGRPWDLLVANEHFLRRQKGEVHGKIEFGVHIEENVYVGEGTRIRSGSYLEGPTYIGSGCDIGPNCYIRPCTYIGDHVRIGQGVEIKNSIVMDHTHIAHLSYVGDSVIGSGCNLGAGTTIANLRLDEAEVEMEVEGNRVGTRRRKLGTIIADNVKTGVNCMINPGVKIGPNSAIGPGAVVYEDVPPGQIFLARPAVERRSWGGGAAAGTSEE
jgi:UDP-N-acetylglucosamine diphosphorylase/glucosamine-1-phosphate N-acetyltransferase